MLHRTEMHVTSSSYVERSEKAPVIIVKKSRSFDLSIIVAPPQVP